nr:hypothetical protein [Tanacetum cinerariifolium]
MTKITDVEASLEQFKSVSLAYQEETSNRFDRISDEVEKDELILMDKGDVTGPILAVKKDLEQKLIDDLDEPFIVLESYGMINKNEFVDGVKLIDDLDEPFIVLESYGMINKNEFVDGVVAPVVVVAPIAAIAPLEQSFVLPERIKQNQAAHHKMFIWYIILKLGYEICLGHLLTNVRLKQESVPAQRRTWDPGITHGDILKQHLKDKVFFGAGVLLVQHFQELTYRLASIQTALRYHLGRNDRENYNDD